MRFFKKKRKEKESTIYDEYGFPLRRPSNHNSERSMHKFQRPTIFTDAETKEILKRKK